MADHTAAKPLAGIRVLDIATFIAAPFCATLLAEFGADVIKIEMPKTGDPVRRLGSMTESGDSLIWLSEGRNKKSVTLDLRTPDGARLFKQLVADADVVCENFRTGTLERWGIGYDTLAEVNPGLVMLRVTGYGQTGPYAERPGFGRIGNAFGGLSYLAGFPDRAPVTPGSATLADYMSGLFGAFGVMVALRGREKTGKGQVVDIGLYESIFRILDELAPAYDRFGTVRERMGPATVNVVPHSHYQARDGRWLAIACTNDRIFARLAEVMGRPELAHEDRYGTIASREADRDAVDSLVSDWVGSHDAGEVLALCDKGSVPCGPVYAIDEIFADPQYQARENIRSIDDPRIGSLAIPGVVPRLTETPGEIETLGPELGEHLTEVFGRMLGLDEEAIAELRSRGIV
jgi:crotonobetainyl-CoA:carnitine CoA-transferase CaiB-like acyl-CoA transferase